MKERRKRINIIEFSAMLGVSTATVSRAFSNKGRISKNTREKILLKATEYGYSPNINAQNLTLKSSNTIAFFYPRLISGEPDFFLTEIMLGMNESVLNMNNVLQIFSFATIDEPNFEFYKKIILNDSLAGIIVIGGSSISNKLQEIADLGGIPCVTIDAENKQQKNSVSFHLENGCRSIGNYFKEKSINQAMYIRGINDFDKLKGFKEGLGSLENGLIIDKGGSRLSDGVDAFHRMRDSSVNVDAVFCANDILAIGFMKTALDAGVRIPQDLAIVGCDDVIISKYYSPSLSTLHLNIYKIGVKAVSILERLIESEVDIDCEMVETKLIIRKSS